MTVRGSFRGFMVNLIIKPASQGLYRLTLAEILYFIPDSQEIIQSYTWQEYDYIPYYPNLKKFLEFWDKKLDGKLYNVRVASSENSLLTQFNFSKHFCTF